MRLIRGSPCLVRFVADEKQDASWKRSNHTVGSGRATGGLKKPSHQLGRARIPTSVAKILFPLTATLIGFALELGDYNSRPIANIIWGVSLVLWAGYGVSLMFRGSPEKRAMRQKLDWFRKLGELEVAGECLQLEMAHSRDLAGYYQSGNFSYAIHSWAYKVEAYFRNHVSTERAIEFKAATTTRGLPAEVALTDADLLQLRLDYIRKIRDSLKSVEEPKIRRARH